MEQLLHNLPFYLFIFNFFFAILRLELQLSFLFRTGLSHFIILLDNDDELNIRKQ